MGLLQALYLFLRAYVISHATLATENLALRQQLSVLAHTRKRPKLRPIPKSYRRHATFYTDQYVVYKGVIPAEQHHAISKLTRKTNHIGRFNNTLRQRVSRLARSALSFSKKLANHIGAIKYFVCHYNLTRATV